MTTRAIRERLHNLARDFDRLADAADRAEQASNPLRLSNKSIVRQRGRPDHETPTFSGKIISVSSVAGTGPSIDGGYAHYGAAKAAIAHCTRYLAQDLGPFGITANSIARPA